MKTFFLLSILIFQLSKSVKYDPKHFQNEQSKDIVKINKDTNQNFYFMDNQGITKVFIDKNSLGSSNSISKFLFYNSTISEVTWSNDITQLIIEENAFAHCLNLKSFILPTIYKNQGSIQIHKASFYKCKNLCNFTFPSTVTKIGESSFEGCLKLYPNFISSSQNFMLDIDKYAFYNCSQIDLLQLPKINIIGKYAFANCYNLKLMKIEAKKILDHAFLNCNFINLEINCASISKGAFQGKGQINKFLQTNNIDIGDYAFINLTINCQLKFSQGSIGKFCFAGCNYTHNANKIDLCSLTIGSYAFANQTNFVGNIILKDTIVKPYAFYNGGKFILTMVPGEKELQIGDYSFYQSNIYGNLSFPNNIKNIGKNAFGNCKLLKDYSYDQYTYEYSYRTNTLEIKGKGDGYMINISSQYYPFAQYREVMKNLIIKNLKNIGDAAFIRSKSLIHVSLDSSLIHIGHSAFYECTMLESISIPDSVTTIDTFAFCGCSQLSSIRLPSYLTFFGFSPFLNCNYLLSITLPKKLKSFRPDTFDINSFIQNVFVDKENPYLESIDGVVFTKEEKKLLYYPSGRRDDLYIVPNETTSIGSYAFEMKRIKYVEIPNSVVSFDDFSFTKCYLQTIVIGSGLSYIGNSTFKLCTYLTNITIDENNNHFKIVNDVLFTQNGTTIIKYFKQNNETYQIPSDVTTIKSYCFDSITSLKSIIFQEAISTLENDAIYQCNSLESLIVDENNKFYASYNNILYIKNFSKIEYAPKNIKGNVTLHENLLEFQYGLFTSHSKIENINIPEQITFINNSTFSSCSKLKSIVIPDKVTSIGVNSFYNCTELKSVIIGSNVISIGDYAFSRCISLESIIIPPKMTVIKPSTFSLCQSLKSIFISGDIEHIGRLAFNRCSNLSLFRYNGTLIPQYENDVFKNCSSLTNIQVLCNYNSQYFVEKKIIKMDIGYGKFGENCQMVFNSTTGIMNIYGSGYMLNASEYNPTTYPIRDLVKNVYIQNGIVSIGDYAFKGNINLESIQFPNDIVYIGCYSFENCPKIQSFIVPNTVTDIGPYAFAKCSSLSTLILSDKLTILRRFSFYLDTSLAYIKIPKNVSIIEKYSFEKSSLNSIIIPESVILIEEYAFSYCTNLSYVSIGDSVNVIPNYCFQFCKNLTEINLGKNISQLGNYSFYLCQKLQKVSLPEKLRTIDKYCFSGCSIQNLTFYEGLICIGNYSFYNCHLLDSILIGDSNYINSDEDKMIKFPNSLASIGSHSFENCDNIKNIEVNDGIHNFGESIFQNCTNLEKIKCNLTSIESETFKNCINLNTLDLGNNVNIIGVNSFQNCINLKIIEMPDSVVEVQNGAFYSCQSLESLKLSNNLETIGNDAFCYCSNLTSVYFPRSLKKMGYNIFNNPFAGCDKIESFTVDEKNIDYYSFDGIVYNYYNGIKLIPPNKNGHFIFPDGKGAFGEFEMANNHQITSATFGKNLRYIWNQGFARCYNLESVVMQDNVEEIGILAFVDCHNLKTVVLSKNLVTIGEYAFRNCYNLSIINYTGVNNFDSCINVFENCSKLEKINVIESFIYDSFCGINVNKNIFLVPEITSYINDENSSFDNEDITIEISASENDSTNDGNINITSEPNETDIPSYTPLPIAIDSINITNDINDEQLNNMLKDVFEKLESNTEIIKIVIINNKNNDPKLSFNSELRSNQYIKMGQTTNIDFVGGNLNMILPDKGKVTVLLNNDKQNKISIKGDGELEIEFQPDSQSKSINLNGHSQINGSFKITVPEKTESLSIDSIELASKSSVHVKKQNSDDLINFTIKNLTATYYTKAFISNVAIQNSLKIYQTATLEVNNVSFDNAVIEYEIFNYKKDNDKWNEPIIKGSFKKPPSLFILKKSKDNLIPIEDTDYTLVSGLFEIDGCEKWLERIDLTNSGFNDKKCENNLVLEKENKKIIIKATNPNFNPDKSDNNKSGLNSGQIAGIVIGCIAGGAIIVVIIVIIIKKMNKGGYSGNEDNSIGNTEDL